MRGFYYEGRSPGRQTTPLRHKEQFLEQIDQAFRDDRTVDAEEVTRAVFRVMSKHVSSGEIDDIKHSLPQSADPRSIVGTKRFWNDRRFPRGEIR